MCHYVSNTWEALHTPKKTHVPEKPYSNGEQVTADQNSNKNKRSPGDTKHHGKPKKGENINEMLKRIASRSLFIHKSN